MSIRIAHSQWRLRPPASLSRTQQRWLMRAGALTTGLRALGALNLRVINEVSDGLSQDEASCLQLPTASPVWVREVVMSIDGTDCVVARSLTPLRASHGVWQGMRRLRSRPLADILYHERSIVRSAFQVARVNRSIPLHRTAINISKRSVSEREGSRNFFARRSVFWRNGYPLLVAECFLPAFWLKTAQAVC